jgi:hypothetical protein
VTLTLHKVKADGYFKRTRSSQTMPALYNGEQMIINFPGASSAICPKTVASRSG